jgi:LexA-binding, inner membrane-associated putative hydrolase
VNRRYLVAGADPLVHAVLAAAVVAPLGRDAMRTAVVAGTLIDVDHVVAARSAWPRAMISLPARPTTHALLAAVAAGALGAVAGGPVHGWAAFAGLASHLLRDAADDAAPTPLLWPWAPPRQIARRTALAGIAALALGSWLVRASAAGGGDTARPRTA